MLVGDVQSVSFWCPFKTEDVCLDVRLVRPVSMLTCCRFRGDARLLAVGYWYDRVLLGVLLDRIQECPEELVPYDQTQRVLTSDEIQDAVNWLRQRSPSMW